MCVCEGERERKSKGKDKALKSHIPGGEKRHELLSDRSGGLTQLNQQRGCFLRLQFELGYNHAPFVTESVGFRVEGLRD